MTLTAFKHRDALSMQTDWAAFLEERKNEIRDKERLNKNW
jgi:hypothetical protein